MKIYIRTSALKRRKMTGFRHKKATRAGRKALNNQRNAAAGRPKRTKLMRIKHTTAKAKARRG